MTTDVPNRLSTTTLLSRRVSPDAHAITITPDLGSTTDDSSSWLGCDGLAVRR